MEFREKIKQLLDEYYGNSRNDDFKEEIVNFVENYSWQIMEAIEKEEDFKNEISNLS